MLMKSGGTFGAEATLFGEGKLLPPNSAGEHVLPGVGLVGSISCALAHIPN